MTEVEKQESQKTVVAFVTGLLIGGLLVWVFSSAPDEKKVTEKSAQDTEQVENKDGGSDEEKSADSEKKTDSTQAKQGTGLEAEKVNGTGTLEVVDQPAGNEVILKKTEFPTKNGWVVIRDYKDGKTGNVLGAARYGVDEGLIPTKVELLRATVKGAMYQVQFYTNVGDKGFSMKEDMPIEGSAVTFTAQ